jgi:hypothetical protein
MDDSPVIIKKSSFLTKLNCASASPATNVRSCGGINDLREKKIGQLRSARDRDQEAIKRSLDRHSGNW